MGLDFISEEQCIKRRNKIPAFPLGHASISRSHTKKEKSVKEMV